MICIKNIICKTEIELNRIIYRYNPLTTYTVDSRDSNSLIYYVHGGHNFDFGTYKLEASGGQLVYIPFGSSYINHSISPRTEFYQIDFNFLKDGVYYPIWEHGRVLDQSHSIKYLPLFKKNYETYVIRNDAYDFFCTSKLLTIIGMLYEDNQSIRQNTGNIKSIEKTVNYLRECSSLDTPIEELAKISSMSVSNLEKLFKKHFNVSPLTYRNQIRIERAKLLLDGGFSVAEAANKVGFSDVYYFSRVFKKMCGMPPSKYSNLNQD